MGEAGSYFPVPVRSRLQRYWTEPPALATSKRRVTVSPTVSVMGPERPSTLTAVTARADGQRQPASSKLPARRVARRSPLGRCIARSFLRVVVRSSPAREAGGLDNAHSQTI